MASYSFFWHLKNSVIDKLNYSDWCEVYIVLEEDGTEVDDDEYFQSLPDNTRLMLLLDQDIWSPVGPAYSWDSSSKVYNSCFISRLQDVGFDEIQVWKMFNLRFRTLSLVDIYQRLSEVIRSCQWNLFIFCHNVA